MKQIKYLSFILAIIALSACNKWLDVSSKSEIRGDDHYENVSGFKQTLIGSYIRMAHADLYGKNLSWYVPEILANQYEQDSRDNQGKALYNHQYENASVSTLTAKVWDNMYNVIVNVNDALRHLEGAENKMTLIEYNQIKGELYALRAYLHFDLLRLYGEYAPQKDFTKWGALPSIPYQLNVSKEFPIQKSNTETVALMMSDIDKALESLKRSDPLVAEHPVDSYDLINSDGFFKTLNLRLNYIAVLALKARLLQWQGSPEKMRECREVADMVLKLAKENGSKARHFNTKIGMLPANNVTSSNLNLFDEALFGLEVPTIAESIAYYLRRDFVPGDAFVMWIAESRTLEIFENSSFDIRFVKQMIKGTGYPVGYAPAKLFQGDLGQHKGRLPLLRLSEVYLMAAEASLLSSTPDAEHARSLLSELREFRGHVEAVGADLSAEDLLTLVYKEYQREFFTEGVQFFVYKRLGVERISGSQDVKMTPEKYRLPFPDYELGLGRKQGSH